MILGPTRKHDLLALFYTAIYLLTGKCTFQSKENTQSNDFYVPLKVQIAEQLLKRENWNKNTICQNLPEGEKTSC